MFLFMSQQWFLGFYFDKTGISILYIQLLFYIQKLRSNMDFFLCVIGMEMIIEGLPYFAFPDKMKRFVEKLLEIEDRALRLFGLFLMILGLFLIHIGRT